MERMISFLGMVGFALLVIFANANAQEEEGSFQHGVPCTPCADTEPSEDCILKVRVNFFASETGYFEFDECFGVNPTLYLTVGRTYLFDQSDDSNWYHLIGFSFNLTDYSDPSALDACPEMFVCNNDNEGTVVEATNYSNCVEAMNWHMIASMSTTANFGTSALFCHQMIPLHQNAINMAKALLKSHDLGCYPDWSEGHWPWECSLHPLLFEIIHVLAYQNQELRYILDLLNADEYANCDVEFPHVEPVFVKEHNHRKAQEEEEEERCTFAIGLDCKPCDGTNGDCVMKLGVNLFAGESGYYVVEGCDGVSPTLHLEVGRTYLFDQSDVSNWYHLIVFGYHPDGNHLGYDELEPGIPPGDSKCRENFTCPAAMYWMNGEYTGEYSNVDSLVPLQSSDDYGWWAVEHLFEHPIGDWVNYGPFHATLNFDDEDFENHDIFYLSNSHPGMSGRIKLIGSDGSVLNEADTPEIPNDYYDCVSPFDRSCGTFNTNQVQPSKKLQCPKDVSFAMMEEEVSEKWPTVSMR